MIILNNKTYCRNHNGVMYDVHYKTIKPEPVIDAVVFLDVIQHMGVSVSIDFFKGTWDEDMIYSYVDRIMRSVKLAEPELCEDIYKVSISIYEA